MIGGTTYLEIQASFLFAVHECPQSCGLLRYSERLFIHKRHSNDHNDVLHTRFTWDTLFQVCQENYTKIRLICHPSERPFAALTVEKLSHTELELAGRGRQSGAAR